MTADDDTYMGAALVEARAAGVAGDVPVGAVIVVGAAVVAAAGNRREVDHDPTAHAEILALRQAATRLGKWRLDDATLYVTLEPCAMCAGALVNARLRKLVYGAADMKAGAVGSLYNLCVDPRLNHEVDVTVGVRADECASVLSEWFAERRLASGGEETRPPRDQTARSVMQDICDLIVEDHQEQRRLFAALDSHDRTDAAGLSRLWAPLASLLELHAAAEESVFYPHLVRRGADGQEETLDAIKDHNKLRDAVAAAAEARPGSDQWWAAVNDAHEENEDHIGEEERDGIPDFLAHSEPVLRGDLGGAFIVFKQQHASGNLDVADKDPEGYVAEQTAP